MSSALRDQNRTRAYRKWNSPRWDYKPWGHLTDNIMAQLSAEADILLTRAVLLLELNAIQATGATLLRIFLEMKLERFSKNLQKISLTKNKKYPSDNLLLKCLCPVYPKRCWKGSALPFWRHSFQQTYCVLMRVYKQRYRTQSNCLPPGFYGPISPVIGHYKLPEHTHSNVRLEKPTGFPHH